MILKLRTILCAAVLAIFVITAAAQTETGQITGTVTDPSGAGIPGATITVRSTPPQGATFEVGLAAAASTSKRKASATKDEVAASKHLATSGRG